MAHADCFASLPADDRMLQQRRNKKCCQSCLNPYCFEQFVFVLLALSLSGAVAQSVGTRGPAPVEKLEFNVDTRLGGYVQGFVQYNDGRVSKMCGSDRYFTNFAAELFCKYNGFLGGGYRLNPLPALANTDVSSLGNLVTWFCPPKAKSLKECLSGEFLEGPGCPPSDIIYLRCYGPGGIRLAGGQAESQAEGRVQLFLNGSWWNVCSGNFKAYQKNVDTTCRLLGFPKNATANFTRVPASTFDPKSTRTKGNFVVLPYMNCTGNENLLTDCIQGSGPGREPISINEAKEQCTDSEDDGAVLCRYNEAVKKAPSPKPRSIAPATPSLPPADSSAPASSPAPKSTSKSKGSDFPLGAIIGIVGGVVLFLFIGLAICYYKFAHARKRTDVEKGGAAQGGTEGPKVVSPYRQY